MKNWGFGLLLIGFGLLAFQQFAPGIVLLAVGAIALIAARMRVQEEPVNTKPEPKPKSEPRSRTTPALVAKPKPKPKPKPTTASPELKPSWPASPLETPIDPPAQHDVEWVPTIVTRTGENESGIQLRDPWKDGDKDWTPEEDRAILEEYAKGNNLVLVSRATVQDMQQVAIRLTRLLLDPQGDLRDDSAAHQHGRPYLPGEKDEILAEYKSGANLDELARSHERTLLGIGWQILDHPDRPTKLNDVAVARLKATK